jgi:hypothetical protein
VLQTSVLTVAISTVLRTPAISIPAAAPAPPITMAWPAPRVTQDRPPPAPAVIRLHRPPQRHARQPCPQLRTMVDLPPRRR